MTKKNKTSVTVESEVVFGKPKYKFVGSPTLKNVQYLADLPISKVHEFPQSKSYSYWAVEYRKDNKPMLMLHLYPNRRLARLAAGNGKKPWYRAVKVNVSKV